MRCTCTIECAQSHSLQSDIKPAKLYRYVSLWKPWTESHCSLLTGEIQWILLYLHKLITSTCTANSCKTCVMIHICILHWFAYSSSQWWCGWGCEVSCGGHHRPRGKTITGSALDGAVLDIAQILAYLVHNMSRSQSYLGCGHFGWLPSFFGQ